MMNILFTRLLPALLIASAAITHIQAAEKPANEVKVVSINNPARSVGVRIGDILQRSMEIEADQPYQLAKNALPVKGTSSNGIELTDIQVTSKQDGKKTRYTVKFYYQVFAHTATPSIMHLPSENVVLEGGKQAAQVHLPAWRFWFSPLVAGNIELAKVGLQPQLPPPLLETHRHQVLLGISLACLLIALIGLVYANADRKWLPFMGGAFAQAYRKLKRLPQDKQQEKRALLHLHTAFNHVYGRNLFSGDIDRFIGENPAFKRLQPEIEAFFTRSNRQLFDNESAAGSLSDLTVFARRLRDCERGVK